MITKLIAYQREQIRKIQDNQTEIDLNNSKMLRVMLVIGCAAFSVFLVISFTVDSYRNLTVPYGVMLIFLLLFLLYSIKVRRHVHAVFLIYAGYGALVLYAAYTSAIITPAFTGVVILFFLFQLPIVILDKSWRVNIIEILYAVFYLICAVPFKEKLLIPDEIANCILFTVMGIAMGEYMRKAQIDNFELKRQAILRENTDYLTGLSNRRSMIEYLMALEKTDGGQGQVGILMVDVDNFKLYNDTYGHPMGDICLKKICGCFRKFGKEKNITFYRYGGEEFVGIVKGYSSAELYQISRELNKAVYELRIPHKMAAASYVTVSIGLAVNESGGEMDYREHLSQSDKALYAAKQSGRNKSVIYGAGTTGDGNSAFEDICGDGV